MEKHELIQFLDLTTLNIDDTEPDVQKLTEKALKLKQKVASICTFPNFSAFVHQKLKDKGINTCAVSASFPTAQTFPEVKFLEVKMALDNGADEIDVVMDLGMLKANNHQGIIDEIAYIKSLLGDKILKVIIESGYLKTEKQIALATKLAIEGGADFVKTSTGKNSPGATPKAVEIICKTIKEMNALNVGVKVSGGVRTFVDALTYYNIVEKELGKSYLVPSKFRIGASSLLDDLVERF